MRTLLVGFILVLVSIGCVAECVAQDRWADPAGRFFQRTSAEKPITITKNSAGKYSLYLYGKNWKLAPKGNRLQGVIYLNARQICDQVKMLSPTRQWVPMPYNVAVVAAKKPAFAETLVLDYNPNKEEFTETHQFFGSAFNYRGKQVRYFDNFDMIIGNRYVRIPELTGSADWAKYITKHKGRVEFSVRDMYGKQINGAARNNIILGSRGDGGHNYLILSSLGATGKTPEEINRILAENIGELFPGSAKLEQGEGFRVGNVYRLITNDNITTLEFLIPSAQVSLTEVTPYYFEFSTIPGKHSLRGTAKHGIFIDGSRELWMFQQGRGPDDETAMDAGKAYVAATIMWPKMAKKMSALLDKGLR